MVLSKCQLTLIIPLVFALNAFPQLNVNAYLNDARMDIAGKRYFEAIQKLDICIKISPGEGAYFFRGISKYYLNDNLGAKQDLDEVISVYDPINYDAFHVRSLVKYRLGDNEGALKDINVVIAAIGDDPEYYAERAFYRLADQNYLGALSDCNKAVSMKLYNENLYLCKGMAENGLGKFDSALINYNIALKINSKNEDIYVRKGMTEANLEKYPEAIEQFDLALEIDSGCTLAYFNRAEANVKLDNYKEAMNDFNLLLKYDPMNALAYFDMGALEASKNSYKNAIADFDKVLELNPKNIQAMFNRAKLNYSIKHYKEALNDFNSTLELYPGFVEAYYERAKLKESMHDYAGAKSDEQLGEAMTEANRLSNNYQRVNDSVTLAHLMELNSDFSYGSQKLSDSININFMPMFYIVSKNNNIHKSGYYPVMLKKNTEDYKSFSLTNEKDNGGGVHAVSSTDTTAGMIHESSLLQKAIAETNMQLFNAAIKDYDNLIEHDSSCAFAYFARGVDICREVDLLNRMSGEGQSSLINKTYRVVKDPKTEKYEQALADFSKIIALEPNFAFAYYDRAYIKFKLQDFNGAVSDYNYAVQISPDLADAWYNRGVLLFCLHDKLNACEDFSKAGELGLTGAYSIIKLYCSQAVK